jgi:hypothetical protein
MVASRSQGRGEGEGLSRTGAEAERLIFIVSPFHGKKTKEATILLLQ